MKSNEMNQSGAALRPALARNTLAFCRKVVAQIDRTRATILSEFRDSLEEHGHLLRLAVDEAEALAWQTGHPHLFFPALAVEKAQAVAKWHTRQRALQPMNAAGAFAA